MLRALVVVLALLCFNVFATGFIEKEDQVIKLLPKLDLHAHLSTSIRFSTLRQLSSTARMSTLINAEQLRKSGKWLDVVHQVVTNKQTLRRVVVEVLQDYLAESTIYLELRFTPRKLTDGSAWDFVKTVVDVVETHNKAHGDKMLVKLLLSIDRSRRFADAFEVLTLAKDYQFYASSSTPSDPVRLIVGVDFGGDTHGGRFDDFAPLFDQAHDDGLKVSIHTAESRELSEEVDAQFGEDETSLILSSR